MIFKTFDSNTDKISSKWGVFGRSFNDIGTAIVGRITDINKSFQRTYDLIDSIKDSDNIWKRLYPSKESTKEQLIDVDSLIPEIDKKNFNFDHWIDKLNDIDKQVKAGTLSWQDYSNGLDDNQKWIAKWGQETEGQIRTQRDLVKANQQARASALAHNEAIKAQAFSAKAGKAALQGLALAGNMILFAAISKGIELTATAIDNWIHKSEKAVQAAKEAAEAYKETSSSIDNYTAKYKELREQLLAAKGNEEETYRVKQQLLDLQTELNEKYGEEYGYLNLVTDAYKDKTDAIRELNKEAANEFLNENRSGIKHATKKMEEDNTYYLGSINEVTDAKDVKFIEKIKEIAEADGITFNGWDFEFRNNLLF